MLEALEKIDEELIIGAAKEPEIQKIRPIKKTRWVALAAALALLFSIPAIAVGLGFTTKQQESGVWDAYNENIRFALDEFSPELLERAKESGVYQEELFGGVYSAEEFIGQKLPKNSTLDPAQLMEIYDYNENGKPTKGGTYRVGFGTGLEAEELIRVLVFSYYKTGGRYEMVQYDFITEAMPYNNAGFAWHDEDEFTKSESPETYIAPDGRECIIIKQEHKEMAEYGQGCGYIGMTIVDRVFIQVEVRCTSFEEAYSRVTEIIDNFE